MINFEYSMPTRIIFGKDTQRQVGALCARYGAQKVLLHYGGGSIKDTGLYDEVVKSLNEENIPFLELGGVRPNPRLRMVQKGIELCRREGIDFILAVGGGSAIDSAKAIALGTPYEGDVWDFFSGKAAPKARLSVGVVLTLPAAGSEASNSCVITNEEEGLKRGCSTELNRPVFAVMNPELTMTLPVKQVVYGAADIMAHVMERYFTNTRDVQLTDRLCEAVLKTLIQAVPQILDNPEDYAPRAEVMWASTLAHCDLLSTGRVGDWASHQIEHELSGLYDVAHGAGLSVVFPAWMRFTHKHDLDRFCQFAVRVWNVEMDWSAPERTAMQGIEAMTRFFKSVGLPTNLRELGVPEDRLEDMARKTKTATDGTTGQFVKLSWQDVLEILRLAR